MTVGRRPPRLMEAPAETAMAQATRPAWPARLEAREGTVLVSFPDNPEARTESAMQAEALSEAVDCLVAALGGYVNERRAVPRPSPGARAPVRRASGAGRREACALSGGGRTKAEQRRTGEAAGDRGRYCAVPCRPRSPLAHRPGGVRARSARETFGGGNTRGSGGRNAGSRRMNAASAGGGWPVRIECQGHSHAPR